MHELANFPLSILQILCKMRTQLFTVSKVAEILHNHCNCKHSSCKILNTQSSQQKTENSYLDAGNSAPNAHAL